MAVIPTDQFRQMLMDEGLSGANLEKALYVALHEGPGRDAQGNVIGVDTDATGDGGMSIGPFQIQSSKRFANRPDEAWLRDPLNNIRYAVHNLGIGNGDFSAWGENNSYNGQPFGALGGIKDYQNLPGRLQGTGSNFQLHNLGAGPGGVGPGGSGAPDPHAGQTKEFGGKTWTIDANGVWRSVGAASSAAQASGGQAGQTGDPAAFWQSYADQVRRRQPVIDDDSTWHFDPNSKQSREDQFNAQHSAWLSEVFSADSNAASFKLQKQGLYQLPNGVVVDLDKLQRQDPDAYAAVAASNQAAMAKAKNNIANDQYLLDRDYRQAQFNNAVVKQDQQLKAKTEARGRADFVQAALDKARGWATSGGKTSFSPSDVGSFGSGLAGLLGLPADKPLLNYTGIQHVDPQGLLDQYDKAMGVSGPVDSLDGLLGGISGLQPPRLADETGGYTGAPAAPGAGDPASMLAGRGNPSLLDLLFGGRPSTPGPNEGMMPPAIRPGGSLLDSFFPTGPLPNQPTPFGPPVATAQVNGRPVMTQIIPPSQGGRYNRYKFSD